jgi:hypothetical protein
MKVTNLVGIVVACALAGCLAQTGTDDPSASTEQGLSATTVATEQQPEQPVLPVKAKLVRAPEVAKAAHDAPIQQLEGLQGLTGADPGAPVQDDGDGKEPDPHPWHMSAGVTAAH